MRLRHNGSIKERGVKQLEMRFRYLYCDENDIVLLEWRPDKEVKNPKSSIEEKSKQFELNLKKIYNGMNHHRCMLCSKIAYGPDDDVLCESCSERTNHTRFSKLSKKEV